MFKSFMYLHPMIYEIGIQFLYWGGLKNLRTMVDEKRTVFEPACGYGRIRKYLPANCAYRGVDLNEKFVAYAQKKDLDIKIGDIFDESLYRDNDIVLLCDILHHLDDAKMKKLLDLALCHSREKVLIVEPAFVSMASANRPFSRLLATLFSAADADGINDIGKWLSQEEYQQLFSYIRNNPAVRELTVHKHHFHYFVEVLCQ